MKKIILCLVLLLCGCQAKEEVSNKNSSIVYQIFPYSYHDSDGNGVGDLKGIINKLDYIQSLGAGSIWLTPISESPTYHKYDVVDYMSVDPIFGTIEDFDLLVKEASHRNIDIVFDLVLNHTSSMHPWFIQAKQDVLNNRNDEESKSKWYNFTTENKTGYTMLGKGYYYESEFWSEMPDLNLDEPKVRDEIEKIVQFWINHGVKGFRLDAPYHYYGGNASKNNEFLSWFEGVVKKYDKDAFVVGEVWADTSTIQRHYESGLDSFFNFTAAGTSGKIVSAIRNKNGSSLANWFVDYNQSIRSVNKEAIDSVFLSNHDQGRSGAYFGNQVEKTKLMGSVLLLAPGKSFIYYGEEIGMLGSGEDPNKRLPMIWSIKDKTGIPNNPPGVTNSKKQDYTSVEDQLKDKDSLLNHYKQVASIRNKSTLYETGKLEYIDVNNKSIYAMKLYNDQESIYVIHNFSDQEQTIKINVESKEMDSTHKKNKLKGNTLTLQPLSSSVIYVK